MVQVKLINLNEMQEKIFIFLLFLLVSNYTEKLVKKRKEILGLKLDKSLFSILSAENRGTVSDNFIVGDTLPVDQYTGDREFEAKIARNRRISIDR